jgi:hypothetical protein
MANAPAMRRAVTGEWWWADPTELYLDDVEEIFDLFQKASPDATLRLDGYELTSVAQAADLKSTDTRDLVIHSNKPFATFETGPRQFRVWISDDRDLAQLGLRDGIRKVLDRRRLWVAKSMAPFYLLLVPIWVAALAARSPFGWPMFIIGIVTAIVFWVVSGTNIRNARRNGRVLLRDSRSTVSFWRANRDLLLVILGIVGTLVTTILAGVILYALGFVVQTP